MAKVRSVEKKIGEIRKELIELGDANLKTFKKLGDMKAAALAVRAYSEARRTATAQIQYKKLTAEPEKIAFLEE